MVLFEIILEVIIVLEFIALMLFLVKKMKEKSKRLEIKETSKMIKCIKLNDRWYNIDDIISSLREENVEIDYIIR